MLWTSGWRGGRSDRSARMCNSEPQCRSPGRRSPRRAIASRVHLKLSPNHLFNVCFNVSLMLLEYCSQLGMYMYSTSTDTYIEYEYIITLILIILYMYYLVLPLHSFTVLHVLINTLSSYRFPFHCSRCVWSVLRRCWNSLRSSPRTLWGANYRSRPSQGDLVDWSISSESRITP